MKFFILCAIATLYILMHSIKTIIIVIAMSFKYYLYGGYVTDRYTVQVCMCIYTAMHVFT